MRLFDVQAIEIAADRDQVFEFVRNAANLPRWAHAFRRVDDGRATLETPAGTVNVGLVVSAHRESGTIDWRLEFADGHVGLAQSRVTETSRGTSIFSFVLHAPPVALERIEGALDAQRATLARELAQLKSVIEAA